MQLYLNMHKQMKESKKDVLLERRMLLGLTQKQVAEKAGIPYQSYQKFEIGERNINTASFNIACKVITALDMDITKFYNGEYSLGAEIMSSKEGLHYKQNGRLVGVDIEEDESKK